LESNPLRQYQIQTADTPIACLSITIIKKVLYKNKKENYTITAYTQLHKKEEIFASFKNYAF
jgi:hypothetical protein